MYHHLMSFHWDTDVGVFLFPGLNITGTHQLIILSVILIILCTIYEGIKVLQTKSRARAARERRRTASCPASETANLLAAERQSNPKRVSLVKKCFNLIGQATVFMLHNTLGYFLMLSVMVYNLYVFGAVVLGLGLGYFLFGHISMRINMENIRARTTNAMCAPNSGNEASSSGIEGSIRNLTLNDGAPFSPLSSSSSNSSSSVSRTHTNYSSISNLPYQSENVEIHPFKAEDDSTNGSYSCRL